MWTVIGEAQVHDAGRHNRVTDSIIVKPPFIALIIIYPPFSSLLLIIDEKKKCIVK